MVSSLSISKFYGRSLPRPYLYDDVKLNSLRIDPPIPPNDPLLLWAKEAHWSMGGISFKRIRQQGKVEDNVEKLQKYRDRHVASKPKGSNNLLKLPIKDVSVDLGSGSFLPTPPAPIKTKGNRMVETVESESKKGYLSNRMEKRKLVRKLVAEFERASKMDDSRYAGSMIMAENFSPVRAAFKKAKKFSERNFNCSMERITRASPRLARLEPKSYLINLR